MLRRLPPRRYGGNDQSRWIPAFAGMTIRQSRAAGRPGQIRHFTRLNVLAAARIDLDDLVLADEQRHAHHRAGFERRRLAAAARGVAAHAGIGLDDLQLDEVRRLHGDRRAVPQGHHALFLAFEELGGITDAGLVGLHLFEGFLLHEVPVLAVAVEELHVGVDHVGGLEVVGRLHRQFDHAAGLDEAVLDAGEGLALARLDVLGLGDDARFVIDQDLHAGLDVVHAIAGHGYSCWAAPQGG